MEIEESPSGKTQMQIVDGLVISRGFTNEEFLKKNETSVELEFPLVLVVSDKIKTSEQMVKIMELIKTLNRPLLIFSEHL